MFGRLKKVDNVLFWIAIILAILTLVISLFMAGDTDGVSLVLGLVAAVALIADYYLAGLFYFIGVDKGYTAKAYLWIAYWVPAIGYLLIVAMPDRGSNPQFANDELPDL